MSSEEQTQGYDKRFFAKYSELVTKVWSSDDELARLLPVAPGAVVEVDRTQPENLYAKEQIAADWNAGPGRHLLHVPETPLVDPKELTEDELASVAAGVDAPGDNNYVIIAILFV
jgi:hypothetical protein